jgi:metallo-beta-lactamase class B
MSRITSHRSAKIAAGLCCAILTSLAVGAPEAPPPDAAPGAATMPAPPPGAPPPGAPGSGGSMPNFATPAGPDTPMAAAHRAAAKQAAGTRWESAYGFLCTKSPRPSMADDATIKPQWIFDNVAIIGDRSTVMYVLKTSGGIMLIDSGFSSKLDSVLLPSLSQLGIEPAEVKYILIAHGHPDHFGGAPYFQTHYGTRVVASAADWDVMSRPPAILPPNPLPWMLAAAPKRDIVVGDGEEIVLGDTHVKAYLIPGHTPGSLGFIFPVKDKGRTRTAGFFGGTILDPRLISTDGLQQYVKSLAHFADVSHERKVDVELQNHPVFDDMWMKTDALAARKAGETNPFVVGAPAYQSFLKVMSECIQATIALRQGS